jgi:hypothetical protein
LALKRIRGIRTTGLGILPNFGLAVLSTGLACLLCEVALRLLGLVPLYISPERDRFWQYDALLGWAHQPGQAGVFETPQFRTNVRINQLGLRDREHTYKRPEGTRRILVLGDSFAWGYGVEEAERFSQVLEASLGVEVINAGVSGYSTDQELLWLREEGRQYDFDLVVLVLAGNDIGDNQQELVHHIYYKPRFVFEAGQLTLTGNPVPKSGPRGRLIYYLSQRSALAYFLVQRYFDFQDRFSRLRTQAANSSPMATDGSSAGLPASLTVALLREIERIATDKEAGFVIVATSRWWNSPGGETYREFLTTLQEENFSVLDVEALPGFDTDTMLIRDDGHWNGAGHAFVAQALEALIERDQLLALSAQP